MKMKLTMLALTLSICVQAGTIKLCSDLAGEGNDRTGTNVLIKPHPVWQPNGECSWVSFAETGAGQEVVPNGPTARFWEAFMLSGSAIGFVSVWADDTAIVSLVNDNHQSGVVLRQANMVLDGSCAAGTLGCEPTEGITIILDRYLAKGLNTLYFDGMQAGLGPSGVLWTGAVTTIPEPAGGSMIAAGMLALVGLWKRRG